MPATNKELEAFSYSVSHDLRAPLRAISGFAQALLEDYPDKLDETGNNYLTRLTAASNQMGQLIDDLLILSKVSQSELEASELDLSETVKSVVNNLVETTASQNIVFKIHENIFGYGDQRLIQIVLDNLLSNAIKYTSKTKNPCIEFGFDHAKLAYYVRDNGVGFDMEFIDKIFMPFQRLHHANDFEGTGIGLATVLRIINRHGGKLWANSKEGKGATFYFTLPKKNSETLKLAGR